MAACWEGLEAVGPVGQDLAGPEAAGLAGLRSRLVPDMPLTDVNLLTEEVNVKWRVWMGSVRVSARDICSQQRELAGLKWHMCHINKYRRPVTCHLPLLKS